MGNSVYFEKKIVSTSSDLPLSVRDCWERFPYLSAYARERFQEMLPDILRNLSPYSLPPLPREVVEHGIQSREDFLAWLYSFRKEAVKTFVEAVAHRIAPRLSGSQTEPWVSTSPAWLVRFAKQVDPGGVGEDALSRLHRFMGRLRRLPVRFSEQHGFLPLETRWQEMIEEISDAVVAFFRQNSNWVLQACLWKLLHCYPSAKQTDLSEYRRHPDKLRLYREHGERGSDGSQYGDGRFVLSIGSQPDLMFTPFDSWNVDQFVYLLFRKRLLAAIHQKMPGPTLSEVMIGLNSDMATATDPDRMVLFRVGQTLPGEFHFTSFPCQVIRIDGKGEGLWFIDHDLGGVQIYSGYTQGKPHRASWRNVPMLRGTLRGVLGGGLPHYPEGTVIFYPPRGKREIRAFCERWKISSSGEAFEQQLREETIRCLAFLGQTGGIHGAKKLILFGRLGGIFEGSLTLRDFLHRFN